MTANNQPPNGILLDLIRYILNVVSVLGGLALVGVLLFILVTRANPSPRVGERRQPAAQAQAPSATPTAFTGGGGAEIATAEITEPQLVQVGKELFIDQGCGSCHTIEGLSSGVVGPSLTDIGLRAEERAKEAGLPDARTYIHESIVAPNSFIVPDCPIGPCPSGMMPPDFGERLTEEQINALVEFLLAQKGGG